VVVGERGTRIGYAALLAVAFVAVLVIGLTRPWALLALLALPLGTSPVRTVLSGGTGRELIAALQGTGLLTLVTGVLLGAGLALSG
jgi:1,4-dihydroxy-2-naphthoate octaprenyltransferase